MKYYEVPVKGTGEQNDPYRPDLPDGVPYVASDGMEVGGKGSQGGQMRKDAQGNDIGPFGKINGKMLVGLPEEWDYTDPNTNVKTRKKLTDIQLPAQTVALKTREEFSAAQRNNIDAFLRELDPTKKAAAKAVLPADSVARKAADFGWDEATLKTWKAG